MKKISSAILVFSLLSLSNLSAAAQCGPGHWVNTGVKGPWGWSWHYNADKTSGGFQTANNICSNFFKDTHNCNKLPVKVGDRAYTSCSYNTGLYTLQGSVHDDNVKTICQVC